MLCTVVPHAGWIFVVLSISLLLLLSFIHHGAFFHWQAMNECKRKVILYQPAFLEKRESWWCIQGYKRPNCKYIRLFFSKQQTLFHISCWKSHQLMYVWYTCNRHQKAIVWLISWCLIGWEIWAILAVESILDCPHIKWYSFSSQIGLLIPRKPTMITEAIVNYWPLDRKTNSSEYKCLQFLTFLFWAIVLKSLSNPFYFKLRGKIYLHFEKKYWSYYLRHWGFVCPLFTLYAIDFRMY